MIVLPTSRWRDGGVLVNVADAAGPRVVGVVRASSTSRPLLVRIRLRVIEIGKVKKGAAGMLDNIFCIELEPLTSVGRRLYLKVNVEA